MKIEMPFNEQNVNKIDVPELIEDLGNRDNFRKTQKSLNEELHETKEIVQKIDAKVNLLVKHEKAKLEMTKNTTKVSYSSKNTTKKGKTRGKVNPETQKHSYMKDKRERLAYIAKYGCVPTEEPKS